jgi:hypothetical protein
MGRIKRFFNYLNRTLAKYNNFTSLFLLLFYILVFSLLLQNSFNYFDPDLGWHLASGKGALGEGFIPAVNHSNYTLVGQEWINHEWLTDIIVYNVYDKFDYLVLTALFALLIVLVLGVIHYFTCQYFNKKSSLFLILILILWGVLGMRPHLGVRMQEVTLLFLPLLLIILFFYGRKKEWKILLLLPVLMYLWSCLHGGFLIGIFLLFAFGAVKAAETIINRRYHPYFLSRQGLLTYGGIGVYGMFALIAFFSTFFTPYGTKLYSFLGGYTNTFYLTHIEEWLPQYFINFNYFQISYIALVVSIIGFYLYYGLSRREEGHKIDMWWLFLAGLLLLMSIKSRRHFPLLFVGTFPLVIGFLSTFLNIKGRVCLSKLSLWMKIYLVSCLVVSIAFIIIKTDFTTSPFDHYCRGYPCRAVEFLKNNPEYKNLNLLAEYGWGGYLIWKYPEGRLFIDGRMPQHQINNSTILEEYYKFFDKEQLEEQLEEYDVEIVLVESDPSPKRVDAVERFMLDLEEEELEPKSAPLRRYLSDKKEWKRVFKSDTSVIYINKQR